MARTILTVLLLSAMALGQGTRTWEQTSYEQFEKGTARGVALRSDGGLQLAPEFKQLFATPATYIWAMAADADGNVYAATGAPARVYRITPKGEASVVLQPEELQVQALAVGNDGAVYAATNPDGRIYRIERQRGVKAKPQPASALDRGKPALDPAFTSTVYYAPGTKYIWALAVARDGTLFAATGDRGEIYRIDGPQKGAVFFKSDEAHIRSMAFDHEGNLIAGSDGSGLIYRVSPKGEAFVLYAAAKREITALAIDPAGNIFAAGVGDKRPASAAPGSLPGPLAPAAPAQGAPAGAQPGGPPQSPIPAPPLPQAVGGAEIYRIATDGSPTRLWAARDELVYALAFDNAGTLLAGTGNKGRVLAIPHEDRFVSLVKATATQVTAFARGRDGALYAASSNLGKVFTLGPKPAEEGTFESDVFDAKIFSRWGRAEVEGSGNYELFARSGNVDNPDRNWSPWKQLKLEGNQTEEVPAARFVQWKAVLVSGRTAPAIERVTLHYLPKNVAPHVSDVVVVPGYRYPTAARTQAESERPAPGAQQGTRDREYVAIRWNARDENDDALLYSVYYRGDGETRWKLLKDRLLDRFWHFEAALLPDGGYRARVVATDALSHAPEAALTDEAESRRFEIDGTAPRIDDLRARFNDTGGIAVTFRAKDNFSPIRRAEYAIDGGEWQFVEPVGQLSDSVEEHYDFVVRVSGEAAEHLVTVRVIDRQENTATGKVVVRR